MNKTYADDTCVDERDCSRDTNIRIQAQFIQYVSFNINFNLADKAHKDKILKVGKDIQDNITKISNVNQK